MMINFIDYPDDDEFMGCGIDYVIFPDDGDDLFDIGVVGEA